MQIFYSVNAVFNSKNPEEMLTQIFKHGSLLGITYFSTDPHGLNMLHILSAQETAFNVITQWDTCKKDSDDAFMFSRQYVSIYSKNNCVSEFSICITQNRLSEYNNLLEISLTPQGITNWYKMGNHIDFERYIKLFFSMCVEFRPLWLYTSDERYDEEFYYIEKSLTCNLKQYDDFTLDISSDFKVDVTILAGGWKIESFRNLLQHGTSAGWCYYMPVQSASKKTELSTDEVVSYIIGKSPAGKTEVSLICIIGEIEHLLTFRLRFDIFFMFTLKPCAELVDLPRTVQHALDLCTDFCILELNTFDARYNYYKEPFDREKS